MKTLLVTTGWGEGAKAGRKSAHTAWGEMLAKKLQDSDFVERGGCCRRGGAECNVETLILEITGLSAGEARECAAEGGLEGLNEHLRGHQHTI